MGRDIHRHYFPQCLDVPRVFTILVVGLCLFQFLAHIAAQILVRHFHLPCGRVFKTESAFDDFMLYSILAHAELPCNVGYIYAAVLEHAHHNSVLDVFGVRLAFLFHDTAFHHVCLVVGLDHTALAVSLLLVHFQREHVGIVHVIAQPCQLVVLGEVAVGADKGIVCLVEFVNQWLQSCIALVLCLVLHHIGQCAFDGCIGVETLLLGVSLYLLVVHFKRIVAAHTCRNEFAVFQVHLAKFLAVCRCVAHINRLVALCGLCATALFLRKRFNEVGQHLALVFAAYRVESLACWSERVALLKGKAHFSCHVVGMLDEILVVVHGELLGLACARLLIFGCALTADVAHVNGLCRLLTVHALADYDDV